MNNLTHVSRKEFVKFVRTHDLQDIPIDCASDAAYMLYISRDQQPKVVARATYRKPVPGTKVMPSYEILKQEEDDKHE